MDKIKLEDFMCGHADCWKIPKPGDEIYSCSASYDQGVTYSCRNCYLTSSHYHQHGRPESALKFDPKLTKLVSEHFNPSLSAHEEMETLLQESSEKANSKQATEKHAQEIKTVVDKNNLLTTTVNKLKTLGRNLKEKNEKYEKEVEEKSSEIEKLKEEVKKAQESAAEKIDSLETQVKELKEKNEKIESDKKKLKDVVVAAKIKIGNFEEENKNLKAGKISAFCNEGRKRKYFCSNSKNGCQEEFLAQKSHEKSCIYQGVLCPSVKCYEVITFKDVDDHMEQSHKMLKVNKEWNFKGTKEDLDEIICCLSSYDQKFFPQAFVKENQFHFKVIMLNHQVNAIPFDVNMTFFLEDGKNFSMKNRVYPVSENDKTNNFLKFPLKQITEYFDSKAMELKRQPKIDFCLKIVNEKMDEIAKEKNQNVESGVDSDEEPRTKKAKEEGKSLGLDLYGCIVRAQKDSN